MTWLQCLRSDPRARRRLVCFPHAGGSASYFRRWASELHTTEVHAVCYPGRAARIGEALPAGGLTGMAAEIATVVEQQSDETPLVFFGHSMGALVAFEAARRLEARGIALSHLHVSACPSPRSSRVRPADLDEDTDAAAARLLSLGGTDAELLSDPAFRQLVMPYVIGDFRMLGAYVYRPGPPLTCRVSAIVGDADPSVSTAQSAAWRAETNGPFRQLTVPGGHFYLADRAPGQLLEGGTVTGSARAGGVGVPVADQQGRGGPTETRPGAELDGAAGEEAVAHPGVREYGQAGLR